MFLGDKTLKKGKEEVEDDKVRMKRQNEDRLDQGQQRNGTSRSQKGSKCLGNGDTGYAGLEWVG